MEFRDRDYFQAAVQRMGEARLLYHQGGCYALTMYCAGLAVECMLRAFRWRETAFFEGRHVLLKLLKDSGLLGVNDDALRKRGLSEDEVLRESALLQVAVTEVAVLWHNNLRFASEARLKTFIVSIGRHLRKKGDPCKANALDLVNAAQRIIDRGVLLWTYSKK